MFKKVIATAICGAMLTSGSVFAEDCSISVKVNSSDIAFDVQPYIENDRTMIPLRGVFEALGATVDWDDTTSTVTIKDDDKTITLAIGSDTMKVVGADGESDVTLDTSAELKDDRTMVPLRAISEALGAKVEWDNDTNTVSITTDDETRILAKINSSAWQYDADNDIYYQVGVDYCKYPTTDSKGVKYQTLGVFVPGAYMTKKDDGTIIPDIATTVNGYTSNTAPIVIPVNTPGYSAMAAPTGVTSDAVTYTKAGFVYVAAGCRGRDDGAPTGVTDLKAAIRYIRYTHDMIPGSTDAIFSFGMSGGGAQSALIGATGNSSLYDKYLEKIGAVMDQKDDVCGSMCWCPITSLDYADEAYEWNMGNTRTDLSDDMQKLSDGLAKAFVDYQNALGLKDASGKVLSITEDNNYKSGTYYDYLKSVIEDSLNHFLADTTFPYTPQTSNGGMHMMGGGDKLPDGQKPDGMAGQDFSAMDGIARTDNGTEEATEAVTYNTAEEYIASLNKDKAWVNYSAETNTATITSIDDFTDACKKASKSVGAFDDLNRTQGENTLFGYADGNGAHFDSVMAGLLEGTEYEDAYKSDLAKTDALSTDVQTRIDMYNTMYYLCDYYKGAGTSDVAPNWRIRTGINQGDTSLTVETNLALALKSAGKNVNFETVWGLGHTMAERTGSSDDNFIAWVNGILK